MLKPARMMRIRVIVFWEYLDSVMRELSTLGVIQIVDIRGVLKEWKHLIPNIDGKTSEKYLSLLKRMDVLIDALKITELDFESNHAPEQPQNVGKELSDLESKTIPIIKERDVLIEEENTLSYNRETLDYLSSLNFDIEWLRDSRFTLFVAGLLNFKDYSVFEKTLNETTGGYYFIAKGKTRDGKIPVVLVTLNEFKDDLNHIIDIVKFERFQPKEYSSIEEIRKRLLDIRDREKQLQEKLNEIKKENAGKLLAMRETIQTEKSISDVSALLGKTGKIYALEGWIPEKHVKEALGRIDEVSHECVIAEISKPGKEDNVPTEFDNPFFIRPFETITKSFGLPSYNEIDPTFFLAFSFPLIFGMMFGDVGEGFVIALAGYVMFSRLSRKDKAFDNFGRILFACGLASIFFGFLYGSIFGVEEYLHPLWLSPLHHVKEGMFKELIGMALFVGVVHMSVGLGINTANRVQDKGSKSFIGSAGKLILFFGIVTIIVKLFGFPIPLFSTVAEYPIKAIATLGVIIPMLLIVSEELMHEFEHHKTIKPSTIVESVFEAADTTIMFLSNTISYSRILILALIHAIISQVIFTIAGMLKGIIFIGILLYYLFIITGTVLLIFGLECLGAYIHTTRLHYYEWFTKFYSASGVEYKPFKIVKRHI